MEQRLQVQILEALPGVTLLVNPVQGAPVQMLEVVIRLQEQSLIRLQVTTQTLTHKEDK
jgi:hypothetical protein